MRWIGVSAAACVVVSSLLASGPATGSTADLIIQVDGLVKSFPGDAGVYVADPNSPQPLYMHDPDVVFIAASLYKLGILAHVETLVDTGKLKYTDTIEIQPDDITEDGSYELAGTVMTVDDALEAMITISDNGTALELLHSLGPANINATLQKLGLASFHIANDDFDDNTTTARMIGQYFTLLAQRKLISAAASDRMLARLERQQINDRLPAQLPAGTVVAHKTGNLGYVTHDAGIIYTKSGPRVVVGMTANSAEDDAFHLLSGLGALVYAAVLEPPANARYRLPTAVLSFDAGSPQVQPIQVTNAGTKPWIASGAGSVRLIWEIRDSTKKVVSTAPAVDANGTALASAGAATGSFTFHVHVPFLVAATTRIPQLVHRSEASLLIVQYSNLPPAGTDPHAYTLFWRAIDPATSKAVASGSSPLGTSLGPGGGTFFSLFNAPALRGTYRLAVELREGGRTVSDVQTVTIEIAGARTYPGDRDSVAPAPGPTGPRPSGPSGSPPPRPSPSGTPIGRTPSPTPTR